MVRGMHPPSVSDSPSRQNGLLALGSAAVLTVYTAGYLKTKAAADKFEAAARRRPPAPTPGAAPATAAAAAVATMPRNGAPPSSRPGVEATVPQLPAMARSENSGAPMSSGVTASTSVAASAGGAASSAATPPPTTAPGAPTNTPPVETPPAAPPAAVDSTPHAAAKASEPEKALPMPAVKLRDGTYYGWGTSRHGDIQAVVTIDAGRIVRAGIAQCLTRYSCSWIAALPPQVIQRQSAEVDYVSGATQSVNAFYYAILEALAQAK
jgi:uncharacterized protein with FMN-binding domain